MIRILARMLGIGMLVAGMMVGILDGTRAIAANTLDLTPFGATVQWLLPRQFPFLQAGITQMLHPLLWDPLLVSVFLAPALVVLFVLGLVLLIFGRDKRRRGFGGEQPEISRG